MSDLAPEFSTLPPEYQALIRATQDTHQIAIDPLQQLSGGRSGAYLYLVSVRSHSTQNTTHLILKIDKVVKWGPDDRTEVERHNVALAQSPPEFALNNMAKFFVEPTQLDDLIAILYTIAGESLQQCRPVAAYSQQSQLEMIFRTVSYDILAAWQRRIIFEKSHPRLLLEKWLGYRLRADEGNIDKFLVDECHADPNASGFVLNGNVLPNPLAYAREQHRWGDARNINSALGFVHGDLHNNNVLADLALSGEAIQRYFLIDFANFDERAHLVYDHSYFEMSYLIQQVQRVTFSDWVKLVSILSEQITPDQRRAPGSLTGACVTIAALRTAFNEWVKDRHPTMVDDLQGQFILSAVAAGLNFCNKLSLSAEERIAAFTYAAAHLKTFCSRFGIPMPSEAKELKLADKIQSITVTNEWEPFLQACHEFDDNDHTYVLVVGPQIGRDASLLKSIGRIGWSLILDFDPDTLNQTL